MAAGAAALAATATFLAGSSAAAKTPALTWRVAESPFRLTFLAGSTPVVSETAPRPDARLGYRLENGSYHGLTKVLDTQNVSGGGVGIRYRVATDEPERTAVVTVHQTPTGASVSLQLSPPEGVTATYDAFTASSTDHFLGGGERPGAQDLRGQAVPFKVSYSCKNTMPAPFFASTAGYGVALEGSAVSQLAFPGAAPAPACPGGAVSACALRVATNVVQVCTQSALLSYRIFAGTPRQIVSAYVRMVGRPILPDPSHFELIKWRDAVSGPKELFEDVDRLRAAHIPLGWILLDNPWESGLCYGALTFDSERFPDPAGMIGALHARGVRFMLWISPLVRRQFCSPPPVYSQSALLSGSGNANAYTLDLTDPGTLATYERGLEKLIELGVDGFKGDRGNEIDLEQTAFSGGSGAVLHNAYPLLYAQAVAQAIRAEKKPRSFPTIFHAASPGSSQAVSGFWAGDQLGTFDGLREAIHDGLSAGLAGYSTWGSDTGGYANSAPNPVLTPEVFVRWAQFSAISPVFEVGGTGKSATFWDFGSRTVSLFRSAAVLHYELFPYLYDLARIAHSTGLPVLRPLALEYPADESAWSSDLEVMVGPNLLAAPVTDTTPAGGAAMPSVYLPHGHWVDLIRGTRQTGGRTVVRPTPLAELPLYLRAGSAIPFAARTPLVWRRAWPVDALTLRGRGGWIYAPAKGRTFARTPAFGRLKAAFDGRLIELDLKGAPRETQVLVAGAAARSVTFKGRVVPRAASLRALRAARRGWYPVRKPFRGVLLKLSPTRGATDVVLRLR